ncbi:MAG: class I SAM-dependent methyltransferase [Chlamydiae bacterium]|nr:class I SAM-dependent methyltransferase [Chlamydiota bacterium]
MSSRPISSTRFEPSFSPRETSQSETPASSSVLRRLTQLQNHLSPQGTAASSSLQVQPLSATSISDGLNQKLDNASQSLLNDTLSKMESFEGWCSKEKAEKMMRLILATKPTVCVEIGVLGGKSAFPTLRALAHNNNGGALHAIDPWSNEEAARNFDPNGEHGRFWKTVDLGKFHRQFIDKIQAHDLTRFCVVHKQTSEAAASQLPPIDILHIDGNHSEKSSTSDVETYLPKVKEGGYIWLNDSNRPTKKEAFAILLKECDLVYRDEQSTFALLRKREVVVLPIPVPEPSIEKAPEEIRPSPAEKEAAKAPAEDVFPPAAEPPPPALQDPQSADVNREDDLSSTSVSPNPQMVSREELAPVEQNKGSVSTRNLLLVLGLVHGLISSVSKAPNLSSALTIVQNQVRSAIKDLNLSPALAPFRSLLSSVDRHPNIAIIVALAAALAVFIYESIAEKKALESDLKEIQAIKDSIAKMETPIGDLKESIVAIIQAKSTVGQDIADLTGAVESLDRTLAIVRSFKQPVGNTTSA